VNSEILDTVLEELLTEPEYTKNAKRVQENVASMHAIKIACDLVEYAGRG
jgi:hypothetical protein